MHVIDVIDAAHIGRRRIPSQVWGTAVNRNIAAAIATADRGRVEPARIAGATAAAGTPVASAATVASATTVATAATHASAATCAAHVIRPVPCIR